jgi:hypothetical protein
MKKLFFLSFLALTFLLAFGGCNAPPTDVPPTSTVPGWNNLVSGVITVKAGKFYDIPFSISKSANTGTVSGIFNVQGDTYENIEVLIMDDTDFGEWKNAHKEQCVYNSGRVNSGNISAVSLAPNGYHLVFDNTPSLLTPKKVYAVVNLTWTPYLPQSR